MAEESGLVTEAVKAGVSAGDESAIASALAARRQPKPQPKNSAPEPKKEPEAKAEGQPEAPEQKAEPVRPTASSEERGESDPAQEKEPEAAEAEKPEAKPKEPEAEKAPTKVKIVVDGKEEEVPFDEARGGYMRMRDYTQKTQELAKERETATQEIGKRKQIVENTINELSVLAQHMVQRLVDEDQRTDWNALKAENPEAWAVKRAEIAEKRELLRTVLAKANDLNGKAQAEEYERQKKEFESRRREEEKKLLLALPEWSDAEKSKPEKQEVAKHLSHLGFTKEETESLLDHRLVVMGRESMLYRKMLEAKKAAEAKREDGKTPAPASAAAANKAPATHQKITALQNRIKGQARASDDDVAKLLALRRKQSNTR